MTAARKTAAERAAAKIEARKVRRAGTKRPSRANYHKARRAEYAPDQLLGASGRP